MIRNLIVFGTFASALASLIAPDVATAQVTTNARLKALAAGFAPYIERAGYYAAGDGGDALYQWNATSTCTDDGGSCIKPNSAQAQGRWILVNSGAVSVKVFGAHCTTTAVNDAAPINAALTARTSVYIPDNTTCTIYLNSSSDGLVLPNNAHLYGQNQYTSTIIPELNFTPSYDFVTGGRFTNIVVASNVGTVKTKWSHELAGGESVTISGSVTSALNGTYTIQSITAPDTFTITTSGVADGTYTDPTHLTGPSGIGTAIVRTAGRDTGDQDTFSTVEIDHLAFTNTYAVPFTWIDLTGTRSSRVHDIYINGGGPTSGQVGIMCSDLSPSNVEKTCFFDDVHDLTGQFGTVLHLSSQYGNTGVATFHQINGYARIGIDATGTANSSINSIISNWYVDEDADPNSWDIYRPAAIPQNTTYMSVNFEDNTNSAGYNISSFAWVPATSGFFVDLPGVNLGGSIVAPFSYAYTTYNAGTSDSTIACTSSGTPINLPDTPEAQYGGNWGGEIITFETRGAASSCVISGNGHSIYGFGSSLTLNTNQTVTLQWSALYSDWEVISRPNNQLPITVVGSLPPCGAAQAGMIYAVSDADFPTYNGALTGNGSTMIPVFCNGSAWTAH